MRLKDSKENSTNQGIQRASGQYIKIARVAKGTPFVEDGSKMRLIQSPLLVPLVLIPFSSSSYKKNDSIGLSICEGE